MTIEFPQRCMVSLQELGARVMETRKVGTEAETLARDVLGGFYDVCMRWGLDGVLAQLEQAFAPLAIDDLADDARLRAAFVERLGDMRAFDGGPRSAKPRLLAEHLVAALGLTLVEPPPPVMLDDRVRVETSAALAAVIDVELAAARLREAIVAKARELCDARFRDAFEKIVVHLDERGMKLLKQPKISVDAVQAVQGVLADARDAVVGGVVRAAIDRAIEVIGRAEPVLAARIDQPVTLKWTPRDVAIVRACEARVPKVPAAVVHSVLESLTDLLNVGWRAPEVVTRPYAASQTFAVGEVIEHPKFGRGTVKSCAPQKIEVEFADGPHTLAHGLVRK